MEISRNKLNLEYELSFLEEMREGKWRDYYFKGVWIVQRILTIQSVTYVTTSIRSIGEHTSFLWHMLYSIILPHISFLWHMLPHFLFLWNMLPHVSFVLVHMQIIMWCFLQQKLHMLPHTPHFVISILIDICSNKIKIIIKIIYINIISKN